MMCRVIDVSEYEYVHIASLILLIQDFMSYKWKIRYFCNLISLFVKDKMDACLFINYKIQFINFIVLKGFHNLQFLNFAYFSFCIMFAGC